MKRIVLILAMSAPDVVFAQIESVESLLVQTVPIRALGAVEPGKVLDSQKEASDPSPVNGLGDDPAKTLDEAGAAKASVGVEAVGAREDAIAQGADVTPDAAVATDASDTEDAPEQGAEPETEMPQDGVPAEPTVASVGPMELAGQDCLRIVGPANAGVPAAAAEAASRREALAQAADVCAEAAGSPDADPSVLFHAATIAQSSGRAGETFALLERAADAGLGAAETRLGDYFLFGVGPEGQDIPKAVEHYETATALGDPAGMTTLALLYQVARGVPRNPVRMIDLMTQAADKNYHFAQLRLAQTYLTGEGVPGRADANLGIPNLDLSVKYFTKAADAGNLAAALELTQLYGDPNSGIADNPEERVRLTRMMSRSGQAPAIAQMGVFYETGLVVDYAPAVAAGLYVKALETGKVAFEDLRAGAPRAWDRETALAFQRILQERGLYNGPLDGVIGAGTAAGARGLSGN